MQRLVTYTLLLFLPLTALHADERPASRRASAPYHPPGMWTWDNWFVRDQEIWHAFYLQLPQAVGKERRWKDNDFYKHVGHATSPDLRNWRDAGPAVCALSGTWNDRHIATGSITRYDGRWWMAFTGRGTQGDGVGLAVSDDLTTWKPAQPKPVLSLTDTWGGEVDGGVFTSAWKDRSIRWIGISDPYLSPLPDRDGWFTMVLCARVLDVPIGQSGCLTVLKSRDLRHWEQPTILAWPGCFERMETPQLWQRGSCEYISFGGVLDVSWAKENEERLPAAVRGRSSHQNYCYAICPPEAEADERALHHVATPPGHYIMKVLSVSPGKDVALFTIFAGADSGISPPYPVSYDADHSLRIHVGEQQ